MIEASSQCSSAGNTVNHELVLKIQLEVHTLHLLTFQWPKQFINPTLTSKGAGSAGLLYDIAGRKKDSNSNPPHGIEHFCHPRKFSYTFLSQSLAQLHHRDSYCSDFFHC